MNPTIYKEPKGVVLVISPFNYPMFLSVLPVVCDLLRFLNLNNTTFIFSLLLLQQETLSSLNLLNLLQPLALSSQNFFPGISTLI